MPRFSFCNKRYFILIFMVLLASLVLPVSGNPLLGSSSADSVNGKPEEVSAEKVPELTVQSLKERIRSANDAPGLPPESRKRIVSFYEKAIDSLERRQKALDNMSQYADALKELPDPKAQSRGTIKPVRAAAVEEKANAMALVDIEGHIAALQMQLGEAQAQLEIREHQLRDLMKRPVQLRGRIAQYEHELAGLEDRLARPKPNDESPRLIRAKRTSMRARKAALETELKAADQEVALAQRELNLTRNQQAVISRKVNRLETLIKTWEKIRDHRQSDVGYLELRQAQESLREMNAEDWPKAGDFLRKLGEENLALSKTLIDLDAREQASAKAAKLLETRVEQTEKDFELTRRRITMMGLTRKAGQWLQSRRETLRTSRADARVALERRNEVLRVNLANDELIQTRQDYLPLKNRIYEKLDQLESSLTPKQNEALTMQAFLLLESRRKLLEETGASYVNYQKQLTAQEALQRKLNRVGGEYRDYINQRLLWTQSADILSSSEFKSSKEVVKWLFSPAKWQQFVQDMGLSMGARPAPWGFLVLGLLVLIFIKPRLRRRIVSHGEKADTEGMGGTLSLLFLILVRGVGIPFVIYLAAFYLWSFPLADYFTRSVSASVMVTLEAYIFLQLVIRLCRKGGPGRTHFQWNDQVCSLLSRSAGTIVTLTLPLLFFVVMIQTGPQSQGFRGSLGRLLFMLSMVPVLLVFRRAFRKSSPLIQAISKARPEGWLSRYQPFWCALVMACPLVLMVLPFPGYYFTAYELTGSLGETAWLALVLVLAHAVMVRGLKMAQVRLAMQKAEAERREAAEKAMASSDSPEESLEAAPVSHVPTMEAAQINEQTSLLIRSILWVAGLTSVYFIWSDIFPAFKFLNNVVLWTRQVGVDTAGTAIMGTITLLNLIVAIIIFVGTFIAVKSGTALLEILMSKSARIDAGSRQSFGLIGQYAIFMVGLFAGLNALGIGWKQFQWLAAAMTVGLSFGLKDIFANFVSGIIILFERPIRLGDTVTVGGNSGTVSRIRIRSTTITDFNRKELIIPNQTFLSTAITNWSLSDDIQRVIIEVGIGYGSNAKRAEELLLKIAADCELVLDTPAPSVYFSGFGADSLDFMLRVYVSYNNVVKAPNQIRHEINRIFQEEGIEIPFAQRDTHLDTGAGPLDIRLVGDRPLDVKPGSIE